MGDIKDKLGEARYFLEQMRAEEGKDYPSAPLDADALAVDAVDAEEFVEALLAEIGTQLTKAFRASGEPFRYNLSAFLSAARSAVFMLRKKFGRKPGFKDWIDKAEVDEKMQRLTEMRDTSIHRRPVRPYPDFIDVDVSDDIRQVKVMWRWTFDQVPDRDALSVCEGYMAKVEQVVAACESLFAKTGDAPRCG